LAGDVQLIVHIPRDFGRRLAQGDADLTVRLYLEDI
jgi:hypothetical protein